MRDFLLQHRAVIGFIVLSAFMVLAMRQTQINTQELKKETKARQRFEDQRAYELCLSGNEARAAIRDAIEDAIRGSAEDIIAASQSEPQRMTPEEEARQQRQLAVYRERIDTRVKRNVEKLSPKDCEFRPQNSAGPQR